MLGGSQLREAIPVDSFVSSQLSAACNSEVDVLNAASSSQLIETSQAIGDWFIAEPPKLVVLSVNLWRAADEFTSPQMRARALFPLPSSRPVPLGSDGESVRLAELVRARLGMAFMDAANALGVGVPKYPPATGPFLGVQHRYRPTPADAQRQVFEAHYQRLMADKLSAAGWAQDLAEYRALALDLMSRGSRVAYFIAPESPRVRSLFVRNEAAVVSALNSLPGASPQTLLDLRHAAETSESDFADATHMLESGRRAIWPRVSAWLSGLQGCTHSPPRP